MTRLEYRKLLQQTLNDIDLDEDSAYADNLNHDDDDYA